VRVELFNVGWISSSAALWRRGEDPEKRIRFPVPCYLLETKTERVLIDTGLHPSAIADPAAFYARPEAGLFELEQDAPITDQLDVSTLTRIVLTHLHFDHAGSLALLPSSIPIVLQRREWEAGQDRGAIERNFLYPRDYPLDDRDIVLADGDHDLFGDGSVELLLTPGRTQGHQSMRVGNELVIDGDMEHFASTLADERFPAFAESFDDQARSADRLRELQARGARVLPGHDAASLTPGRIL